VKKALIIVVILLIAGFAISYYVSERFGTWTTHHKRVVTKAELQKAAPKLLSYVPRSAALSVHVIDIGALKTAIQKSNYFKQISSTPFWQKTVSGAEKELEQSLKDRSLETAVKVEPPDLGLVWDFVGEELALAVVPGRAPDAWVIAFLAKVKKPTRLNKITKLVVDAMKNEGLTVEETKYKGQSITTASKGAKSEVFYLCQTHGLLTGANDLTTLQSIIDLVSGERKDGLATAADYTSVASELRPGHIGEFYMKLGVDWTSVFSALAKDVNASSQPKMGGMPKMVGDSLTRFYVKDGVQFESYTALDVKKSDAKITKFYTSQPNRLPLLSAVPWGSTMMMAMNCLSAKDTYDLAIDSASSQNPMAAVMITGFITELEKNIGISIANDLLPAVGPDIAFYYRGISFKQDLPLPEFGFVCSSTDPPKLLRAFPKIGDYLLSFAKDKALKAEHKSITYKDIPIQVVQLAVPVSKKPAKISIAAAVVDKYFCVGFGAEQVKTMIDCLKHGHPLLKDQSRYKSISEGYPETVNQTVYLDFDAFWQQVKSLLELYAQVNAPDKRDAFQFVDMLLKPVKTVFVTSLYEHPSSKTAVQRSYGQVKIEDK